MADCSELCIEPLGSSNCAHVHLKCFWTLRLSHMRPLSYLEKARKPPGDSTPCYRYTEPTSQLLQPQNLQSTKLIKMGYWKFRYVNSYLCNQGSGRPCTIAVLRFEHDLIIRVTHTHVRAHMLEFIGYSKT